MLRRSPSRPAAPRLLDPILTAWERYDRRRRRIRPARAGSVVGLELRRHRGPDFALGDGATVRRGDLVGELHVDNAHARALATETGWLDGLRIGRGDLAAIARWAARQPASGRPVAYHAAGLLWPLAARVGFSVHRRRRTAWVRLDEWYARWLLGHWSAAGRARLARGRGRLRSADAWISGAGLGQRFGEPSD
jgi:hypothetical protein